MRPGSVAMLTLLPLLGVLAGCSDHVERLDEARQAKAGATTATPGVAAVPNSGVVPPLPGSGSSGVPMPGGAATCAPKAVQAVPAWRPPTPPQKACTQAEGSAVVGCLLYKQGCQTPVSQACQACAVTTKGMTTYNGPIIYDPQTQAVEINVEGCAALRSGNIAADGCGGRLQAMWACEDQACSHCTTANERAACIQAAGAGPCAQAAAAAQACAPYAQQCIFASEADTAFQLVGMFCGQ